MAKKVLEYSTVLHSCLPQSYAENDHGWSFCIYSCGTVKLKSWESSYVLRIPQSIVDKMIGFLKSKKSIIDALPSFDNPHATAFRISNFSFFRKKICCLSAYRWIDASFLSEISANNITLQDVADKNSAHRRYLALEYARNQLMDIFSEVCSYLRPHGLSVGFKIDGRTEDLVCEWNIPNHFYCYDEKCSILKYVGDCSFDLFRQGSLKIEDSNCIYQLKIPQGTVDKIIEYCRTHSDLMKSLPSGQYLKQVFRDDPVIIVRRDKDHIDEHCDWDLDDIDKDEQSEFIAHTDPLIKQIEVSDCLFTDIYHYLEPYGLEAEFGSNRISCKWILHDDNDDDSILMEFKCAGYVLILYASGTVHLINDSYRLPNINFTCLDVSIKNYKCHNTKTTANFKCYDDVSASYYECYNAEKTVKTVFYLPQDAVSKLRRRIVKCKAIINSLASNKFNISEEDCAVLNLMGTEIVISQKYPYYLSKEELKKECGRSKELYDIFNSHIATKENNVSNAECTVLNKLKTDYENSQEYPYGLDIEKYEYCSQAMKLVYSIFNILKPYGLYQFPPSLLSLSNLLFFPNAVEAESAKGAVDCPEAE